MWDVVNFFLNKVFEWGYLKYKVYSREPETLGELVNFIQVEINNLPHEIFLNVIDHFQVRLRYIQRENGFPYFIINSQY